VISYFSGRKNSDIGMRTKDCHYFDILYEHR
jgi:hypothetical protein